MAFVFTFMELIDMIVMSAAAGFIFMDAFRPAAKSDPVEQWRTQEDWKHKFMYSVLLVAPPLLLHELAHKFVAMAYGLTATFHAAYTFLGLGVVLKLMSFPFLVIVPAYVSIIGQATPAQHALIAFSGPAIHLMLFVLAYTVLRSSRLSPQWERFWQYTKIINGILFVFNMLPIPGFDGSKVFAGLFAML